MADNLKFSDAALALLKANLGYYDSTIPADLLKYLTYLLTYALDSFAGMGIVLSPGVLEDDMDQMTYQVPIQGDGAGGRHLDGAGHRLRIYEGNAPGQRPAGGRH